MSFKYSLLESKSGMLGKRKNVTEKPLQSPPDGMMDFTAAQVAPTEARVVFIQRGFGFTWIYIMVYLNPCSNMLHLTNRPFGIKCFSPQFWPWCRFGKEKLLPPQHAQKIHRWVRCKPQNWHLRPKMPAFSSWFLFASSLHSSLGALVQLYTRLFSYSQKQSMSMPLLLPWGMFGCTAVRPKHWRPFQMAAAVATSPLLQQCRIWALCRLCLGRWP